MILFVCSCSGDELDDGRKYLAAFIVSMILQGFGAVPLYVLGVTYLDDASSHGTASVHIGTTLLYTYRLCGFMKMLRLCAMCD